jgi:predicted kinase
MKSLQLEKPHAIVMVGIPGSGKTFFASKFAEMFHAPYIDKSAIAQHAADDAAASVLAKGLLAEILKTKQSIVIEGDTDTRVQRMEIVKQLKSAGYVPLFVWAQVDIETAKARSIRQLNIGSDEYDAMLRKFVPPTTNEKVLVISGKHTYATQARIVLKKLSVPRQQPTPQRPIAPRGQIIIR